MDTYQGLPDFGPYFKELRIRSGFKQSELCQKIGSSKQSLSLWENKHAFPSTKYLKKIANIFQVSYHQLTIMHQQYRLAYIQNLISKAQTPIVSTVKPVNVPILDESVKLPPAEAVKNLRKSKYKRVYLPQEIAADSVFGFEINDNRMQPRYRAGDVILVNMKKKPQSGEPALVKVKGYPPVCRFYFESAGVKLLKTIKMKDPAIRVKKPDIDWCYGLISSTKP